MASITLFLADLLACLRFYTRLTVPVFGFEPAPHDLRDFGRAIRATPLAGAVIGGIGALTLLAAHGVGMPATVAAGLALAALALTTGCFHEDGLADSADGLGGGATRERKLDIMKDSRVGSYGATALVLSFLLRYAALAALLNTSVGVAATALVAAHAASRATGLLPLALLPPARAEGAAFAAARPSNGALTTAAVIAFIFGSLPLLAGIGPFRAAVALFAAVAGGLAMTSIARRHIGGQTGDIAGAAQQIAEIAMLCVFSARI